MVSSSLVIFSRIAAIAPIPAAREHGADGRFVGAGDSRALETRACERPAKE